MFLRTKMPVWGKKVHAVHALLAVSSQLSALSYGAGHRPSTPAPTVARCPGMSAEIWRSHFRAADEPQGAREGLRRRPRNRHFIADQWFWEHPACPRVSVGLPEKQSESVSSPPRSPKARDRGHPQLGWKKSPRPGPPAGVTIGRPQQA